MEFGNKAGCHFQNSSFPFNVSTSFYDAGLFCSSIRSRRFRSDRRILTSRSVVTVQLLGSVSSSSQISTTFERTFSREYSFHRSPVEAVRSSRRYCSKSRRAVLIGHSVHSDGSLKPTPQIDGQSLYSGSWSARAYARKPRQTSRKTVKKNRPEQASRNNRARRNRQYVPCGQSFRQRMPRPFRVEF